MKIFKTMSLKQALENKTNPKDINWNCRDHHYTFRKIEAITEYPGKYNGYILGSRKQSAPLLLSNYDDVYAPIS